ALDQPALRLANRLVGNPEGAAGLETTLTGCRLRALRSCRIAVTGAEAVVAVGGRALPWGSAVAVPAGSELVVGPALRGLRSYVGVAGGIEVQPVLGSRSTDLLSGLGPAPLARGARFLVGTAGTGPEEGAAVPRPFSPVLHLDPRPREDWFEPRALAAR